MALVPVVVMIKGDFLYHLIAVDTEQTMGEIADHAHVIGMGRMRPDIEGKTLAIRRHKAIESFSRDLKAGEAGLKPMDALEVYPA